MVMILTVPVFAAEAAVTTSEPDVEVSTSTPDLIETPADEDISHSDDENDASEPASTPTTGPVTTFDELLDAIEHASPNDVIELGAYIMSTPSELVLGRTDCPVTIRRASYDAALILGSAQEGNIKVQNITFDGAGIQAGYPFVWTDSPVQSFEKCNFINCITASGTPLFITNGETAIITDCYFSGGVLE